MGAVSKNQGIKIKIVRFPLDDSQFRVRPTTRSNVIVFHGLEYFHIGGKAT